MPSIVDLSDEPIYSIKSVADQTGIQAVTLRAWERRHEVLTPHRADNRYRLYSERDIAILKWLKNKVDSDVSISMAVLELRQLMRSGAWPEISMQSKTAVVTNANANPRVYIARLYKDLIARDENAADATFREIQTNFDIQAICLDILTPCLHQIGDAWYHGEIRISGEHFASAYIRGKLLTIFQSYSTHRTAALLLVGGAPSEQHEIPALIVSTLLRHDGYRVEYLGPDLPLDDLVDYASYQNPAMIILSATMELAAIEMRRMQSKINQVAAEVKFGFGGQIFKANAALINQVGGIYLGDTFLAAQKKMANLVPLEH